MIYERFLDFFFFLWQYNVEIIAGINGKNPLLYEYQWTPIMEKNVNKILMIETFDGNFWEN